MNESSVAGFLDSFLARGTDCAYVQRRGYRTVHWSYRDVAATAYQFARELDGRKIAKGDCVLIWGPNSAEWVSVFFGCALRGVVAVPIDDVSMGEFVQKVFAQVDAKLLVCSREHADLNTSVARLLLDDLPQALAAHLSDRFQPVDFNVNGTLEIVFTSGTTAEPKGVVITHGNVLANVAPLEAEIRKYLKYERIVHPLRFLNLLPLSHVFGQFLGIFLPQLMGATVVFQDTLKPSEIVDTIRREGVSVLVAVPRILQSLKEKIERDIAEAGDTEKFQKRFQNAKNKHFLHRWWIFRGIRKQFGWKFWAFICGGATLDSATEDFWHHLGYAVIQGYGLTETTSLISLNHPFRSTKGSIGKVMAGREVTLAPDGEIMVRGGGVAASYWQGKELRPLTADEGWYRTGDIGELDAAGNLHFKGRVKDTIVTPAGMKVYPDDLEAALRRQPEIKDCAVVGLPLNGNAEPCAALILRDRRRDAAAIVSRANKSLAEYQRMRRWYVWPDQDFPRTATQKPRKNEILEHVLAATSTSGTESPSTPLSTMIAKITGRSANLSRNASLGNDLNLSSLDRISLLGEIEDRYQIDLSNVDLTSASTVGDLERMLQGQPTSRVHYHYPAWVQRRPVTWIRLTAQYLLLRPAVFFLARPRIHGGEELAELEGPVLVICNHISDVDLGFVSAALPARLGNRLAIATAGEELEALRTPGPDRRLWGRLYDRLKWCLAVSLLNLFPLPRQAGFRESFEYAGESADRGYSILVFPEGGHTADGNLRPFRAGIGLLANNLGIPIIPMRIHGLFEVKQAGRKFVPGKIRVEIGSPLRLPPGEDPEEIAQHLQGIMERL
ncbi:MAG: AMP-binding protein [Terriglobales bacterium]